MTWHIPHLIQQPKTDRMEPSYFHITVCATNAFWGMRKTLLAFEFCRNSPKPSILFCVPSTKHYLEKSGETSHTLESGDKGERGHCSSQLWVRGRRGQSLPFASLSQSCSLDGMESPSQLRASLAAEHLTNFPSTLQFLAVLCPVGLTPPQVAVVPGGGGALHHGLRPPPVSQVQLVPEQGQIPLPSAVAFLPRIVHARHGQPCLVLVVVVVVVAGGLIFREVTSLPDCFGLGFAAGLARLRRAPGSALPPVPEQLHPREAAAPGSVCIHLPCVQARLAGPLSEPAPNRSHSRALSPPQGTVERELPPPGCLAARCPSVPWQTPSLSALPGSGKQRARQMGKGGQPPTRPWLRQPAQDPDSLHIELHLPVSWPHRDA